MRLQLALALGAIVSLAAVARAQEPTADTGEGRAVSRILAYSDDDATSVVTVATDAEVMAPGDLSIGAHALVDAVSSASVDVVSAATERWEEDRVEIGARLGREFAGVMTSAGYVRSQENDWLSHTVVLGASRELFERNTRVATTYRLTQNDIGRASDPNFERSATAHALEINLSQLLDSRTRVGGGYGVQRLRGYLASPYRFVVAADNTRVPERHPDSRVRHALSGYVHHALGDIAAGRAEYRLYRDDWGILSHTAGLRLAAEPYDALVVGVEGRLYRQSRADFYRGSYTARFRYMSSDRELSPFWDAGGGGDLSYSVGPVTADVKAGWIHYRFKEFARLPRRNAVLLGAGLKVDW